MSESSPLEAYQDFKQLLDAMIPSCKSPLTISLFWTVCNEFVDMIGDDDLYFQLQGIYENLLEDIK